MKIELSKDEARKILWALQIVHAQETKRILKKGENPREHRTTQNLSAASEKINSELVRA